MMREGEEGWVPKSGTMAASSDPLHRSVCAGLDPGPEQDISEGFIEGQ